MCGRLTDEQRERIARSAIARYEAGESWVENARDHDLHPGSLGRIIAERHEVTYRRSGQKPVADPAEVARRRDSGETIEGIGEALGCSRTAVRTALVATQGLPMTRYPELCTRRSPTGAELAELRLLIEQCPPVPRARLGHLDMAGPEGLAVAGRCLALVVDGVPMQTLSLALEHGATWVHWLLGRHDLRPAQRQGRSTSRRAA